MNKFFLISALLAMVSGAQAEVITLTPNAAGVGGGITGPGTTVSGNLVTWNSTTGAAVADSGIVASNVPLLNATINNYTGLQKVLSAAQYTGFNVNNGTYPVVTIQGLGVTNDNGSIVLNNGGTTNVSLRAVGSGYINNGSTLAIGSISGSYPLDVTGNIRTTTGLLINGSTVIDTIQSGNTSAQARTLSIPNNGNVTDSFALLGGPNAFSGPGPASGPAANTTSIMGGSTVPTPGANAGVLTVGGLLASAPTLVTSQGAEYITAANGLVVSGYGTTYDSCLANRSGTCIVGVQAGATTTIMYVLKTNAITNNTSAHIWISGTAPTVLSGFATSGAAFGTANGTLRFDVNIGATGGSATGSFTLPAATTDWKCHAQSKLNYTSYQIFQTAYGTNTATLGAYTFANPPVSTNFAANDVLAISCVAN